MDGCSLTIGEVWEDKFTVYLIPETMRVTVFGAKTAGDSVNIEIEAQTQVRRAGPGGARGGGAGGWERRASRGHIQARDGSA